MGFFDIFKKKKSDENQINTQNTNINLPQPQNLPNPPNLNEVAKSFANSETNQKNPYAVQPPQIPSAKQLIPQQASTVQEQQTTKVKELSPQTETPPQSIAKEETLQREAPKSQSQANQPNQYLDTFFVENDTLFIERDTYENMYKHLKTIKNNNDAIIQATELFLTETDLDDSTVNFIKVIEEMNREVLKIDKKYFYQE